MRGLCECGCGARTRIAPETSRARGWQKGEPIRFIKGHNAAVNGPARHPDMPEYIVDPEGCWVWQGSRDANGYGRTRVRGRGWLAHRLYYFRATGQEPATLDHTCRNPGCVNPEHLEPVARGENVRRGKRSKLTWEGARFIRRSKLKGTELAAMYGVHTTTISNVRAGRVWAEAA